ncbi:NAD(P)/FAD-dependent oxidoreductase [Bacillota bacterium]
MLEYKLAIVGGGAAGMMAAISAAQRIPGEEIVLIEKNRILGRKVLATGNGRCNFTNRFCQWQDYGGRGPGHVRACFQLLSPSDTVSLFEKLGIPAREEGEGRLYPYSEQASSLVDALLAEIDSRGIHVLLETEVNEINKRENKFRIKVKEGKSLTAERLIIATGGKAGLKFGSTGDGYGFAKSFGHTLRRPLPGLVQIVTNDGFPSGCRGVRAKGAVSLRKGKDIIAREKGEIQFTGDGVSGICVFDLSRYLGEDPEGFYVQIDLFPDLSKEELLNLLRTRKNNMPGRPAEFLLKGMLNDKLIPFYLEALGLEAGKTLGGVSNAQLELLAEMLKCREAGVKGTKGWVEAQVTLGGVSSNEIREDDLESKLVPGLFFAGEVLDVDGKCGGWNLQWAWSSGWTAGFHAAAAGCEG